MILGLTGGIGSGKSTVARIFRVMGVPVFEADRAGREVLDSDLGVRKAVEDLFGPEVYAGGKADRRKIASLVFDDEEKLRQLNAIIHPAVARAWKAWANEHPRAPMLVREAAILFESGSYRDCDKVVTISAPEGLRIQRVMQRDGVTEAEVRARMSRQWTEKQRREKADIILVNDGVEPLIPQVVDIVEQGTG